MADTFLKRCSNCQEDTEMDIRWLPLYTVANWQTLESRKTLTPGAEVGKMNILTQSCRNMLWLFGRANTDPPSEMNGLAILFLSMYFRERLLHAQKDTCSVTLHAYLSLSG